MYCEPYYYLQIERCVLINNYKYYVGGTAYNRNIRFNFRNSGECQIHLIQEKTKEAIFCFRYNVYLFKLFISKSVLF